MRFRVDYYLRCATQGDAEVVSARIVDGYMQRVDFENAHGPAVYQDGDSHLLWVASGGGWFTTEVGAREVQAMVADRMNSGPVANRIVAGSVVELHPCNNEDSTACDPASVEYVVK